MQAQGATDMIGTRTNRLFVHAHIQEERRQLRDLIATLTPYSPRGLEELAARGAAPSYLSEINGPTSRRRDAAPRMR